MTAMSVAQLAPSARHWTLTHTYSSLSVCLSVRQSVRQSVQCMQQIIKSHAAMCLCVRAQGFLHFWDRISQKWLEIQTRIGLVGLCSVLRPCQHSIGYMRDGFYRSKDPTNSIKGLMERKKHTNNKKIQYVHTDTKKQSKSSSLH